MPKTEKAGASQQRSSAHRMSFQPAIPGGLLSSRARFRFAGRTHSATLLSLVHSFPANGRCPFLVLSHPQGKCTAPSLFGNWC